MTRLIESGPHQGTEEFADRVARGAALLDQADPGWQDRINPLTLNIADPFNCVLGQLYGMFSYGTHYLEQWAADHGYRWDDDTARVTFGGDSGERRHGFDGTSLEYRHLTDAWLRYILGGVRTTVEVA